MKAYAVVRKPQPSTKIMSHTFKLQNKNPEISIDPIQENRSLTPRKADSTLPEHMIQTKSKHFKVQESFSQHYRQSKSPARKHPIFNQIISQFLESKKQKSSQQKLNLSKIQQNISQSRYEPKSIHQSNISSPKLDRQSKVQPKEVYTTPQKIQNRNEQLTPFDLLHASEREKQGRPLSNNHKNRIFGQFRNTSKQKRLSYFQGSQERPRTFQRALGPQLQLLQYKSIQKSYQKDANRRQRSKDVFGALKSTKYDNFRQDNLSSSQVDIGCCGEQLKQNNHSTKYQTVNYRQDNYIIQRDNSIMNGIGLQFLAHSQKRSIQIARRRIFNQTNPQLQKSKRQTQNYKQDKIQARSLINEQKPKQRKVVVFEINSYSPFEF